MTIIKTDHLKKYYPGIHAVDGINLEIYEGEIYGIVGPDGAGKTTLMRLLTSILLPTEGTAFVNQFNIVKEGEKIKEHIGYMSQKFGLYGDLTVSENMEFYADIYGIKKSEKQEKIKNLLTTVDLYQFKNRRSEDLSGGMKQKLGLACALVHTPKILFLDEPTNGVDPVSRREFWHILYELHRKKTTIFLSTSYMEEAERCGRVAFMHQGKILSEGTPDELKTFLKGRVLEVRCPAPRKAMLLLKEVLGFDCVKLFGNRIHIYLYAEDTKHATSQVAEILETSDLGKYTLIETDPTLEDIFMAFMRENERAEKQ